MNRKSSRLSLRNNLTTHSNKKTGFTPTPIGKRKSAIAQLVWGFTLLELIIVIIIIGILATLGLTTYTNQIEYSRAAEAKANLGVMRKLAYEYYLKNGSFSYITASNIGGWASCTSTSYFSYYAGAAAQYVELAASRCTSGGKSPNASRSYYYRLIYYPLTS